MNKRQLKHYLKKDFLKRQEGRCAICGDEISLTDNKSPSLDHDHQAGGYRGVLCDNCNCGLGHFFDSIELLQKAIQYLKIPRVARFPRMITHKEALSVALKGNQNGKGHKLSLTVRRTIARKSKIAMRGRRITWKGKISAALKRHWSGKKAA